MSGSWPGTLDVPGRTAALCNRCGAVRTVGTRYRAPGPWASEAFSPEHAAKMVARRLAEGHDPESDSVQVWQAHIERPWARCLGVLRCAACGIRTEHALIRQDEGRDHAERPLAQIPTKTTGDSR